MMFKQLCLYLWHDSGGDCLVVSYLSMPACLSLYLVVRLMEGCKWHDDFDCRSRCRDMVRQAGKCRCHNGSSIGQCLSLCLEVR